MPMPPDILQLVGALRRIGQSLDTHSKTIEADAGVTLPQLLLLEALHAEPEPPTAGRLAQRVSLSQGTVTSILDRLEARGLVRRTRSEADRRRVLVQLTVAGRSAHAAAPPLLHADFIRGFSMLAADERGRLLDAVDRIAEMMRAAGDPSPLSQETAQIA
ncbi:MAG: MarR family transcriptional regulator [Pseudomonadota bacterium]